MSRASQKATRIQPGETAWWGRTAAVGASEKVLDCILVEGEGFLKEETSNHQHDESGGHFLGRRKCVYKVAWR